ncbi:MAG: adenylosuccinate lyase [Candidatus Altarchaeum sp. CG12_big_fil_rev_8_21_14_0_65_33_22]|nr:MAG: adenylosuccinate lyase [Candidatus Altarchaeum sp. CG12_big_fil_rev_8_21_14_0_65_33_22]
MIHPIEYRYGRKEVKEIFDEEKRLEYMLKVECALVKAHYKAGNINDEGIVKEVEKKANLNFVRICRVKEIENEINHDVMAVVKGLSEVCEGDASKFIHLGITSNDVIDTANALQFADFVKFLESDLLNLRKTLVEQAERNKQLVCIGRTHGQHAIPTTYGMKFAIYAMEIQRHIERLNEYKKRLLVGKISGAVGTYATLGNKGIKIEKEVMQQLNLTPAEISNQVVQRDRYAEFFIHLALIAKTLEKIAVEIRNLQRTEIDEIAEHFEKGKQVGSSTMPQKRNPITGERICGIVRIIVGNAIASLDNIPLWHERDLTNSSAERIIIPEICILSDYILNLAIKLIKNLEFRSENIDRNLNLTNGMIMSECLMINLTKKGLGRQEAHELVRECAMRVYESRSKGDVNKGNINFRDVLLSDKKIRKFLTEDEIRQALNPKNYIGLAVKKVEEICEILRKQ